MKNTESYNKSAPDFCDVSIIGPGMNESGNLEEFVERCFKAFDSESIEGEVILVDDGSTDNTHEVIKKIVGQYSGKVRGIRHRRNFGKTEAIKTGLDHAQGKILMLFDTDLETHPDEDIPVFMAAIKKGADVVSGYRQGRSDGKVLTSKIYNFVSNKLFGMALHDMNWMKAFKRECIEFIELRGDWHRFILMMLHKAGFKIAEEPVNWYPRKYGESKYGIMRIPLSFIDVISIWFILTFNKKPMRLFGTSGIAIGMIGLAIHLGLTILFLVNGAQIRPLFWFALALELIAIQTLFIGFLAELIERNTQVLEDIRHEQGSEKRRWIEIKPD